VPVIVILEKHLIKKLLILLVLLAVAAAAATGYWATRPIIGADRQAIPFTVLAGSSVRDTAQQIADADVPLNASLFALLVRFSGKSAKLKAGSYDLKPGTSPLRLIDQLVRGEYAQESLAIIEGWSFRQMRLAIAQHSSLKHDTAQWSDAELLAKIAPDYKHPEGLFFPDTYLFAKGSSDLQIYRRAHALMLKQLADAWDKRDPALPYKSPYDALIMASIVEKETGHKAERGMIAGVFVNRLKQGMLLQTDPTVIYGLGAKFDGNIRKRDLLTDTPYNTYVRPGLPPTPIALAGTESLHAALHPARTDAIYFVSRGDGTSVFSAKLEDHNRAVNKYQR
jgi:UPF0755 protein